jgi:predicted kinase
VLLARPGQTSDGKADVTQQAQTYFELAQELIHPPAPMLVAVGGLSGTGKSVLARALASEIMPLPGAVILRSDVLRKQHFQVKETERLPSEAYEPRITAEIYDAFVQRASHILAQGHSVVVDAVFAQASERASIRDAARRMNVRFVGLFLQTDLVTRQNRVGSRESDASDATPEVAAIQEKYDLGEVDWAIIDASGTPEQALKRSRIKIARHGTTQT